MSSNEILGEIRRTRDATIAECGGDLARLFEYYRSGEARWMAAGHPLVSFIGQPRVELPPPDWERIDTLPENEIIAEIRATRRRMVGEAASDCRRLTENAEDMEEADSSVVREEPPTS